MKHTPRWALPGTCIIFLCVGVSAACAEDKRPMTMIDVLEVPSLNDPQLSPDGQELLYRVQEADWAANRLSSQLWRLKIGDPAPVQSSLSGSSFRWSPDGDWIAYLGQADESRQTQVHLASRDQFEAGEGMQGNKAGLPVTDLENVTPRPSLLSRFGFAASRSSTLSSITWAPDSKTIYFLAPEPPSDEEKQRARLQDDVFSFDRNYKQWHLWKVNVPGGQASRITEGNYSVLNYSLSRDGTKIVFHRGPTPLYQDPHRSEVWVMDADGKNALQLTDNEVPESPSCCGAGGAEVSPDNSQVLFLAKANEEFDYYYKSSLFLTPASGGKARMLLSDLPYEIVAAHWSRDGKSIYFLANMGVRNELFEVDVETEDLRQLTDGKHSIRDWEFALAADQHVLTIASPNNPGDVWLLPVSDTSASPKQVTRVFDYLERDFELPRQEKIEWTSVDGVVVEGLLDYPLDYEEGRRYPLVMQSHGGMANSDQFGFARWSDYIPVLASRGYAVLRSNYRGSGGYGDDFQRDMIGKYFNKSHLDVMAGVDHVIEVGIADPDRLIKRGWSAGGYMTNKIITFTDRFKAASSGAGMVNWVSFYSQSDIRHFRDDWLGGSPWEKDAPIDNFWEQSPLSDIAEADTPTIIFVGEDDVRVPPEQSIELFRALEFNDVPTELYIAPREGHGWSELRHRLFKMNAELDWFEKYALNREYKWEEAPVTESYTAGE